MKKGEFHGMAYKENDIRGTLCDPINIENAYEIGLDYECLKNGIIATINSKGIPAKFTEDTYKSGGFFSSSSLPMLVISHPSPDCKYFSIGVFINQTVLNLPLLGGSAENYKYNMREQCIQSGNVIKAAMYRPDEMKLQQERIWEDNIFNCIMSLFS